MPEPHPVDDITLVWGESLRWDDRRQRLYFVDCGPQTLHWLEDAQPPLQTLPLPSLPTGLALAEDGRLVAALDDGLHVVDPDVGTTELLSPYPAELGGRANDACATLLAETFGVPASSVELVTGASSRMKRFRLQGVDLDEFTKLLTAAVEEGGAGAGPRPTGHG